MPNKMIPNQLQYKSRYPTNLNLRVTTQKTAVLESIPNKMQYKSRYPKK